MPRKKKRRLTAKQQELIRQLAKTKHQGKAAIAAGYSPKHARQSAYQALESIRKTAPELLARHGLDDDSLIDKHLLPLMNAEETKFFTLPVGKGKDRRLQIENRKTANWSARQHGLDIAFKIRGLYVRNQENKGPEVSVIITRDRATPVVSVPERPALDAPGRIVQPERSPSHMEASEKTVVEPANVTRQKDDYLRALREVSRAVEPAPRPGWDR